MYHVTSMVMLVETRCENELSNHRADVVDVYFVVFALAPLNLIGRSFTKLRAALSILRK